MSSSRVEKKRYAKIDPRHIKVTSDISQGLITEVTLTNIIQENVAFKFRMRDPSKCSVRPPKGFIPPSGQQVVKIHVMPTTFEERIDKIVVDTVPLADVSEIDSVWKERKNEIVKQPVAFKYEGEESVSEAPSECPSGFVSVAQTPADPLPTVSNVSIEPVIPNLASRLEPSGDGDLMASAVDHSEVVKKDDSEKEALAAELKELKEKYDKLLAERNELQTRVTALQGQNAKLQANADVQQKKIDVNTEEDRAERRSWFMFGASVIILIAVIIYSFVRPSSKPEL